MAPPPNTKRVTVDDQYTTVASMNEVQRIYSHKSLIQEMLNARPPRLRAWWTRLWCALRGHGGISPLPGTTWFMHDGLCKRCGARVSVSGER